MRQWRPSVFAATQDCLLKDHAYVEQCRADAIEKKGFVRSSAPCKCSRHETQASLEFGQKTGGWGSLRCGKCSWKCWFETGKSNLICNLSIDCRSMKALQSAFASEALGWGKQLIIPRTGKAVLTIQHSGILENIRPQSCRTICTTQGFAWFCTVKTHCGVIVYIACLMCSTQERRDSVWLLGLKSCFNLMVVTLATDAPSFSLFVGNVLLLFVGVFCCLMFVVVYN